MGKRTKRPRIPSIRTRKADRTATLPWERKLRTRKSRNQAPNVK
ncbi:Protein of unknown function [Pyronema omphalodes CBS 100304]|uniref:Uncharacterized protein n=1 Tax=Pyronema omphalodes (strain CBS 100304) TaxID=1076935 RepID=U4LU34_PYROM|nr:Protein of unknown function [Pyronema omphalodes CBS 100304]